MALTHPDFTVSRPAGLSTWITDAMWWFWLRLQELEPTSELGGIAASKRGFHSSGQYNLDNYPNDYSIRDAVNRQGPLWKTKSSALDWTFPEAHQKNYNRIAKYMQRLLAAARDPNDPRLDVLYEFFGQADTDTDVEGWNEFRDTAASSDPSHLFHIHFSLLRLFCGDFWAMWAILTVLMGWSVAQWRASLGTPQEEEDDMKSFFVKHPGNTTVWLSNCMTHRTVTSKEFPWLRDVLAGNGHNVTVWEWPAEFADAKGICIDSLDDPPTPMSDADIERLAVEVREGLPSAFTLDQVRQVVDEELDEQSRAGADTDS